MIFANIDTMVTPSLVKHVIWNHKSLGYALMFLHIFPSCLAIELRFLVQKGFDYK
jgi:hypothetical protein